jgi:AcrR family transcriptional regulator
VVRANQRSRLLEAVAEIVGEAGYDSLVVAEICRRARVSAKTFYTMFDSRAAAFVAAAEDGLLGSRVATGVEALDEAGWRLVRDER